MVLDTFAWNHLYYDIKSTIFNNNFQDLNLEMVEIKI